MGSNLFLTVGLSGLIAIPGTLLCVFVVGRCGRRWTIGCSQLLTALCFLAILGVPKGVFAQDWPRVLFAGLGVVGMSVRNIHININDGVIINRIIVHCLPTKLNDH